MYKYILTLTKPLDDICIYKLSILKAYGKVQNFCTVNMYECVLNIDGVSIDNWIY
jgi:hypothetical protein